VTRKDFGLAEVVRQLARRGGGGFEWYKDSCLRRRIEVRMRARGVASLSGYAALLAEDAAEVDRLLHTLSIRVTSFFRNPDTWGRLRDLLEKEPPGLRRPIAAWSMGCATGEEAWSLAMLLQDAVRRGDQSGAEPFQVIASDVDARALAVAEAGRYPGQVVEAIRKVLDHPYGAIREGRFEVDSAVRARVTFRREDLTAAAPAPARFELVCCRNVLIFLGRDGQRRLLEAAFNGLRPGGLLVLGRTESLFAIPEAALAPVDPTHRIYRRAA
jgi:chemotaxis methyl-accepting protein methylase